MSRIPEFKIRDSENFRVIYAMGAFGGLSLNDGRMILYVDRLVTKPIRGKPGIEEVDRVIREREIEVHMSPATWKSIAKWMMEHLNRIEKQFGVIPEEPKPGTLKPKNRSTYVR